MPDSCVIPKQKGNILELMVTSCSVTSSSKLSMWEWNMDVRPEEGAPQNLLFSQTLAN